MKKQPFVIGVTGGSGSGKSTFVRRLRDNFQEEEVCLLSMDDYYKPREEQESDEQGVKNFDLPSSIDAKAFRKDLKRLINGETVEKLEYTFNNEKTNPKTLIFKPAPVIIVEGLFVFHNKKIRKLLDLRLFLHAKENLKVIRRIRRDQIERNYPIDDVLYRYEKHVLPAYEQYIEPYREMAHVIVNNNDHFHKGYLIMKGFIENQLAKKDQTE